VNEHAAPADFNVIGQPVRRKEDARLLTGQGRFSDDFSMDGQVYAALVRSPHPHARIVRIDSAKAKSMPGALGVLTGADVLAENLGAIPHTPVPSTRFDMKLTGPGGGKVFAGPHFLLPADKARHVGEAVAMVVAATRAQALDAAEAVEVQYEELPFVTATMDALAPGAPALWNEALDNVLVDTKFGDAAATDRAFATAAHVVKMEFDIGRVTAVPMELRSSLAHYDAATDRYTLYAGSGGAVKQKQELAGVLGIPPAKLRILSFDVGGNFGARHPIGSFSHRLPRPRSRHQSRARALGKRKIPRASRR
jgi:aerobic carbon-monoxide dehydrogenase large subunit